MQPAHGSRTDKAAVTLRWFEWFVPLYSRNIQTRLATVPPGRHLGVTPSAIKKRLFVARCRIGLMAT